ncbi:MAG: superoxide dismutase family protein [Bauldia sp.]
MRSYAFPAALAATLAATPVLAQPAAPDAFVMGGPFAATTLMTAAGETRAIVTMTEGPNGLLVRAEFQDLAPGTYGLHVHETGACTPDFEAAGGHFNPTDAEHGFLAEGGPHAGDLPNVVVPESGRVTVEFFAPGLSVDPGPPPDAAGNRPDPDPGYLFDADGAALVLHAMADDYMTQPAGHAGDRIACGVLLLAQP